MTQRVIGLDATAARRAVERPSVVGASARERTGRGRRRPGWVRQVVADAVAIASSATVVVLMLGRWKAPEQAGVVAVVVVGFLAALVLSGSYGRTVEGLSVSRRLGQARVWHAMPLGVVLVSLMGETVRPAATLDVRQAVLVAGLSVAAIPTARLGTSWLVMPRRRVRRVLIVGTGRVAARVTARLRRCSDLSVVGVIDDDPPDACPVLGSQAQLSELCAQYDVDAVVVAFSSKPMHETLESLRGLGTRVPIWVVPRFYELVSWRSLIDELDGIPLVDVAPAHVGRGALAVKRMFDIVVAGLLLVLLSPLFAAVAGVVKMTSPGPVMFRQFRSGKDRQPFRMYKFRTMHVDAESQRQALSEVNEVDGPIFKMRDDPRVTPVGRWLRQTSLDELPQLINVLRGEMSLVGPRPFPVDESDKITGWATIRFSVPPGMTGLWQVSGRNELDYEDLRHLDHVYVASWSFGWDLRILLQTPASVLFRRGVL